MKLSISQRLILGLAWLFEKWRPWYRQPKFFGLISLLALRTRLRQLNLHDTSLLAEPEDLGGGPPTAAQRAGRTSDGRYNDLDRPGMGAAGTRFGRNMPFWAGRREPEDELLSPSPREVSRRVLARGTTMSEVPVLNQLAAAWIQFQIHDWVSHGPNQAENPIRVALQPDDEWSDGEMHIRRSTPDPTRVADAGVPSFRNTETHWWDGSQIYGSTEELTGSLRGPDGTLAVLPGNDLLPLNDDGVDHTGVTGNYWLGLSGLHTLFVLEHNAICAMLAAKHPEWGSDRLFQQARLVNAALMAKIHTIEWTPAILWHDTVGAAMRGNWYGLFGSKRAARLLRRFTRSDLLIGIPGSSADHHGAPYGLTEEFVSVYRLHPLLPDAIDIRSHQDDRRLATVALVETFEAGSRRLMEQYGIEDVLYSLGRGRPGSLTLRNYPETLRNLTRPNGVRIDLATVDVMRDRERGVPRYNQFRKLLRMPEVNSFEELTGDRQDLADELRGLYGSVDRVDLMVGLYAEPLPAGFGFSETAFRIFVVMASRRLKSDRFFTDDYRPEVYTREGIRWIEDSDMRTVILRHAPALAPALQEVGNAFKPWSAAGGA